jgi:hypothetical protein
MKQIIAKWNAAIDQGIKAINNGNYTQESKKLMIDMLNNWRTTNTKPAIANTATATATANKTMWIYDTQSLLKNLQWKGYTNLVDIWSWYVTWIKNWVKTKWKYWNDWNVTAINI